MMSLIIEAARAEFKRRWEEEALKAWADCQIPGCPNKQCTQTKRHPNIQVSEATLCWPHTAEYYGHCPSCKYKGKGFMVPTDHDCEWPDEPQ